jgi:hypothetical protein
MLDFCLAKEIAAGRKRKVVKRGNVRNGSSTKTRSLTCENQLLEKNIQIVVAGKPEGVEVAVAGNIRVLKLWRALKERDRRALGKHGYSRSGSASTNTDSATGKGR